MTPAQRLRRYRRQNAARLLREARNPEALRRRRAGDRVRRAIADGRLVRPSTCSRCGGNFGPHAIHAHHPDYSWPLFVVFLCRPCHQGVHAETVGGGSYAAVDFSVGSTTAGGA